MRFRRVQRTIVAAAIVLAVGVMASPRPAGAHPRWVIVPGEGWGPIRLGMTEQEVYAVFGAPLRVVGENRYMRDVQFHEHVFMTFGEVATDTQPRRLSRIRLVDDPAWMTREGVRIGSPLSAILKAYGDSSSPRLPGRVSSCLDVRVHNFAPSPSVMILTYPRGVAFTVDLLTQKVSGIDIMKAEVPPNCS